MMRGIEKQHIFTVLALIIVGSVLFYSKYPDKFSFLEAILNFPQKEGEIAEYRFADTHIRTSLNYPAAKEVYEFMSEVYPSESLPQELSLLLQVKRTGGGGDEYAGGWLYKGQLLNTLYVASPNPNRPSYLRAWYLITGTEIDEAKSRELLRSIFSNKIASIVDRLTCKKVNTDSQSDNTICDFLVTGTNGDKLGVLVRSPIKLPTGQEGVAVSTCLYPKESSLNPSAAFCN